MDNLENERVIKEKRNDQKDGIIKTKKRIIGGV